MHCAKFKERHSEAILHFLLPKWIQYPENFTKIIRLGRYFLDKAVLCTLQPYKHTDDEIINEFFG